VATTADGLSPYSTVYGYFYAWRDEERWSPISECWSWRRARRMGARRSGDRRHPRSKSPGTSQSVKTMESGGPRRHDAGKKSNGRKRQIITDT
jgi:hypothetical protein